MTFGVPSWIRHTCCTAAVGALGLGFAARPARGQPASLTVRGTAFDSIANRPLADGFVTLDGTRSATTDAAGRFRFDSVVSGRHRVEVQHAALDAMGFSGLATEAKVEAESADVRLSTPSFATLWRLRCGGTRPPNDSGFVYGTVANVFGAPVGRATVVIEWIELGSAGKRGVVQRQWRGEAQSAANGGYGICGVPVEAGLRIQASTDSASSGSIDLPPEHPRVLRRDLRVARFLGNAGALRGTIVGFVTDSTGHAVPNARVVLEDANEVRADDAGRFVLRDVPTGTRQIEALGIGMRPVTAVADVGVDETTFVTVRLRRVTRLEVMRVTASARTRQLVTQFEARQRLALGYTRDSTAVASHGTLSSVFAEVPGVYVERSRGTSVADFAVSMRSPKGERCMPAVWIDAALTNFEHVSILRPDEIAMVEAYPRAFAVPTEFSTAGKDTRDCGVVVVWTKFFFR